MPRSTTKKVAHRKGAVQKRVITLELPSALEDWLEAEAEKNFRSAEQQALWVLQCAMNGDTPTIKVSYDHVGALAAEIVKKKAWKPLTSYAVLDKKPSGTLGTLKAINGAGMGMADALSWTFQVGGPASAKVFEIERELAEHVVGNPSLASMGLQLQPLGEYQDWAYFQRTG